MEDKQIKSIHGHNVLVTHEIVRQPNHIHVIHMTGFCGSVQERRNITLGLVDGPRVAPPSAELLQKQIDGQRQEVADEASWKERITELISQLK